MSDVISADRETGNQQNTQRWLWSAPTQTSGLVSVMLFIFLSCREERPLTVMESCSQTGRCHQTVTSFAKNTSNLNSTTAVQFRATRCWSEDRLTSQWRRWCTEIWFSWGCLYTSSHIYQLRSQPSDVWIILGDLSANPSHQNIRKQRKWPLELKRFKTSAGYASCSSHV